MNEVYDKLWKEMLDSSLNAEYYSTLASRFSKRDTWTKISLAIMSSGTVAGWAIWNDPNTYPAFYYIWRTLSGFAMLTSIALPFLNYSKKVEWASTLKIGYEISAKEFEMICQKKFAKRFQTLEKY